MGSQPRMSVCKYFFSFMISTLEIANSSVAGRRNHRKSAEVRWMQNVWRNRPRPLSFFRALLLRGFQRHLQTPFCDRHCYLPQPCSFSENLECVLGAGQLLRVLDSRIAGCTVKLERRHRFLLSQGPCWFTWCSFRLQR